MEKIIKNIICVISMMLITWFAVSWIEVATNNSQPDSDYNTHNLFMLSSSSDYTEDTVTPLVCEKDILANNSNQNESLSDNQIRVELAVITAVNPDAIVLTTLEDGAQWIVNIGRKDKFSVNDYLCVFFNTMNTNTIYDDEIIKVQIESW